MAGVTRLGRKRLQRERSVRATVLGVAEQWDETDDSMRVLPVAVFDRKVATRAS